MPDTVEEVERLTRHPMFSIENPNKVRSLIGALASGNPSGFNRADGKGYQFVADRVLEIDKFNPQVAARLLGAFRSWRSLEERRRALAKKALKKVAGAQGSVAGCLRDRDEDFGAIMSSE